METKSNATQRNTYQPSRDTPIPLGVWSRIWRKGSFSLKKRCQSFSFTVHMHRMGPGEVEMGKMDLWDIKEDALGRWELNTLIFPYHRTTKWLRLAGTSKGHLVQHPAQAGSIRASCPGPCPDYFWTSPSRKTPQPLWATCASALPSPQ